MDYSLSLDTVSKYIKNAYFKSAIATEKYSTNQINDILLKSNETRLLTVLMVVSKTWTVNPSC